MRWFLFFFDLISVWFQHPHTVALVSNPPPAPRGRRPLWYFFQMFFLRETSDGDIVNDPRCVCTTTGKKKNNLQKKKQNPKKNPNIFTAIKQTHPGEMSHTAAFSRFSSLLLFQRGCACTPVLWSFFFCIFLSLSLSLTTPWKGNKRRGGCGLLLRLYIKDVNSCWLWKKKKKRKGSGAAPAERGGAGRDVMVYFIICRQLLPANPPGATVSIKGKKRY